MQSGRAESSVQPQQWMECRRHRTAPDSDEIPRRRRTGLVRDNQTDLDCGLVGPVSDPVPSLMAHWREIVSTCGSACHATWASPVSILILVSGWHLLVSGIPPPRP